MVKLPSMVSIFVSVVFSALTSAWRTYGDTNRIDCVEYLTFAVTTSGVGSIIHTDIYIHGNGMESTRKKVY